MWRAYFCRQYSVKTASLAQTNYKELSDANYLNFVRRLKIINHGRKSAPKTFDFRALELHNIERINKSPKVALDLIPEYIALDKGTEEGLKEMCDVIEKHFDKLITDPEFYGLLTKLSHWTLALNGDLLERTSIYIDESLKGTTSFSAISQAALICANNAARLDACNQPDLIQDLVVPIYESICGSLKKYKQSYLGKISTYSKARLYNSLAYLDLISPGQFTEKDKEDEDQAFNRLKKAADNYKNNILLSSKQIEVYKILTTQQIRFEREKKLDSYLVDAYVDPKTIIEFDGKPHYYSNTGILTSKRLVKSSYLKRKGYDLININYKDWETPEGRKKVLREILFNLNREEKYAEAET